MSQQCNKIIIIGGVTTGQDAYDKIRAGASLVQMYTAFAYQGPMVVSRMKEDLVSLLRADGFDTIGQAVGVDVVRSTAALALASS